MSPPGSDDRAELTVHRLADPAALHALAARHVADAIGAAVAARGRCLVALAGGSTPRPLYERLARDPALRAVIPWEALHVFWGDERCVPPDHPDSNYRMAQQALLAHVPIPPAQVHRVQGELAGPPRADPTAHDAHEAARRYEAELRAVCDLPPRAAPGPDAWPRLDLILLGLGADGHTASLFPGSPALDQAERLAVATHAPDGSPRVTLTLPVLNAARQVFFVVSGADKAAILERVLGRPRHGTAAVPPGADPGPLLPAQLVRPHAGQLVWFVAGSGG